MSLSFEDDQVNRAAEDHRNSKGKVWHYNARDILMYNIGVGAKASELKYTYEHSRDFQVVPSFATLAIMNAERDGPGFRQYLQNFNPMFLLHGEQYFYIPKFPIPETGVLTSTFKPVQITRKGTNVVVVEACETVNTKGEPVFYNEGTNFIRNCSTDKDRVFRQRCSFAKDSFLAPTSNPDFEIEVPTSEDQAAFYRLTGDRNPLHIDPIFAEGGNFPKPILHGMCTFGLSCKVLNDKYGQFREAKLRLTGIVYPGETLLVRAWKKGDLVIFQTLVKERNTIAINNAAVKLVHEKTKL